MAARPRLSALVLAGGRASRLGGADKPGLRVGGRTLLAAVTAAAAGAGVHQVVVVGPARPELAAAAGVPVSFTSERPPRGGPVPALRAGLRLVTEPWLLLLAADLPFLRDSHLRELVAAAQRTGTGAMLVDDGGRPQWLAGCWHTARLRAALAAYQGRTLGGLLGPLGPERVAVPAGTQLPWLDCDTAEDLAAARREADDDHAEHLDRRGVR